MKLRTIKKQLIISFLVISLFLIGSMTLIYSRLTQEHFGENLIERQAEIYTLFAGNVGDVLRYPDENQKRERFFSLSEAAMDNQFYFSVYQGGKKVWGIEDIQTSPKVARFLPENQEAAGTITTTQNLPGTGDNYLEVTALNPQPYRDHDVMFIASMNRNIVLIGFLALAISLLAANWIAGMLSRPFIKIRDFSEGLTKGEYDQLPQQTSILEVSSLISSLNYLSQELQEQADYRRRITGDIAHELRTPLASVLGNLEAMIEGIWEMSRERLQFCADEINRLSRLIGNLELIHEIETNPREINRTSFSLLQETQKVVENFLGTIHQKHLAVVVNGTTGVLVADKDRILQVLSNLLANSIKFTPPGGWIRLTVSETKDHVCFEIADNGLGISSADLPHIFERFYRADTSRHNRQMGQGIGLSVVKTILEAHAGTIRVESTLGLGTKFSLDFRKGLNQPIT